MPVSDATCDMEAHTTNDGISNNKASIVAVLEESEQCTSTNQCILCGFVFTTDVGLISHLTNVHQTDLNLKTSDHDAVFQKWPYYCNVIQITCSESSSSVQAI